MGMFVLDVKECHPADRGHKEQEGEYDDPTDQAFEKHTKPCLLRRTFRRGVPGTSQAIDFALGGVKTNFHSR
jgi:hypothetical protein